MNGNTKFENKTLNENKRKSFIRGVETNLSVRSLISGTAFKYSVIPIIRAAARVQS